MSLHLDPRPRPNRVGGRSARSRSARGRSARSRVLGTRSLALGVLLALLSTTTAVATGPRPTPVAATVDNAPISIAVAARPSLSVIIGQVSPGLVAELVAGLVPSANAPDLSVATSGDPPAPPGATAPPSVTPKPASPKKTTSASRTTHSTTSSRPSTTATKTRYVGRNRMWMPALGINRTVSGFPCSRSTPPGNDVYRWGCAGRNNVYLFGHAYSVFKPLHDAYVSGRLRKGMKVAYADGSGRVHTYAIAWWRLTTPANGAFAYAGQSRPSMTLQTCVGARSQYRLIVRLVQVS